jgi:APA family basic amino acid/polyamine antiporter
VVLIGGIAAVVAATGTLAGVASAASFLVLVYYGISNLAALRMPVGSKRFHDLVPTFGLAACAVLALSLAPGTILIGLAILAVGFLARPIIRRASAAP